MKILIDLWLDGYDTEEEMKEACIELIKQELDMSASSVEIVQVHSDDEAGRLEVCAECLAKIE